MSAIGALIGLALAIALIIKKVSPCYSLLIGALIGGLIGGLGLVGTVSSMIGGIKDITPAVVRILSAGVLSGVLIRTGAAESIAHGFIKLLGAKYIYWALALSAFFLTAVGVFVDVAVLTVAPIALLVSQSTRHSKSKLLLMLVGGAKCGNIISPNPNTIVAAENFGADLYSVMAAGIIPAILGLLFTVVILSRLYKDKVDSIPHPSTIPTNAPQTEHLPHFLAAVSGPIITIALLSLRPICGWVIDPLIALPAGGMAGLLLMRKHKQWQDCLEYGLGKMAPIAILLIGTGAVAGIVKDSSLTEYIVSAIGQWSGGEYLIAPVAGILMAGATASTTAGATIASSSFSSTILELGIPAVWGAAMVNAGSTVIDHLPHGSFFHATGGSMECSFSESLRLIPYESLVGLVLTLLSTLCCYCCTLL